MFQTQYHYDMYHIWRVWMLLLGGMTVAFAQKTEKDKFTDKEIATFIKVYQYELNNPFEPLVVMQKNIQKTRITESRLTEIMQAQALGYNAKITDSEKSEMEKLQKILEQEKLLHDKKLEQFILKQEITVNKYKEIKNFYTKNKSFQERVNQMVQKSEK